MPQQKIAEPMQLVHNWLEEFRKDKRAAQKAGADATAAADNTEPTTHPVMDADPQTEPAAEGARGKENTSDVKDQVGGDPITGQQDANTATSDQPTDEMGTKKMDADEVRGNVKEPKATKDGPAESGRGDASPDHPTSEEMKNQEKYSEFRKAASALLKYFADSGVKQAEEAAKKAKATKKAEKEVEVEVPPGTEVEVEKENGEGEDEDEGEDEGEEKEASDAEKRAAIERYPNDFDNGFVAASMILQQMGMAKQAEDTVERLVDDQIASVVASARQDADDAIDYLEGFQKGAAVKEAAGEMPLPPELLAGGGAPEEAAAEAAAEGAPDEAAMAAEEAGAEGEEAGAEGAEDAIIEALAQAGVTPEELEAALGGVEGSPEAEKAAEAINRKVAAAVNRKRLQALLKD